MIREIEKGGGSGLLVLLLLLVVMINAAVFFAVSVMRQETLHIFGATLLGLVAFFCLFGLFIVNPNEAKVLQLFGNYVGTVRRAGLHWTNPFYSKKRISIRTRNFETGKLKVNDKSGNPIEIAAVVVWRVADTAEALFNVDDYINFLQVQSEAAERNLATHYCYVAEGEADMALSSHSQEMSTGLQREIQARLEQAGIAIVEARLSHLAYAPEIASAMLQKQQATAVVAARAKIVEGAVGMVEHALEMLSAKGIVELDSERRVAMVSNLLVVLCGDRHPQPVINAGSLYQ